MKISIKYCAVWNYEPKAVSLTQKILERFKQDVKELTLIPSDGGCFEISVNGKLIYSKLEKGSFPNEDDVIKNLQKIK